MPREPITRQRVDELLRYLPLFEAPDREFFDKWSGGEKTSDGAITMPHPVYLPDVEEFFRLAGQPCWSDYDYDPVQAGKMLADEQLIRQASMAQVKTMLTYCARGERFCDGLWGAVLGSGRVQALLRRLRELREEIT